MSLNWPKRLNAENVVVVTPTIDTNAYTSGDRLGSIQEITNVLRQDVASSKGIATLKQIAITDLASQKADIDLLFFNALPTVASADNAAIDISDAEIVKFIGSVSVGAAYIDTASNSVSTTIVDPGLKVYSASGTSVWVVAVIRDSATYGSASDLQFKYSFEIN